MQVEIREVRPGGYRCVIVVGNRPRPLCDCDGGHPDPRTAADCPMAGRSLATITSNQSLQSILANATGSPRA